MIKFTRDSGFDDELSWSQDYCVSYTKKDGTIGYKKCGSIDEVNTFRAEQDGEMVTRAEQDGEMVLRAELMADACEAG